MYECVCVCVCVCMWYLEAFLGNTKEVCQLCSQNFFDCYVPVQIRDQGCVCVCVRARARASACVRERERAMLWLERSLVDVCMFRKRVKRLRVCVCVFREE